MPVNPLPYVDADAITSALRPRAAVQAVLAGLRAGVDPAADSARSIVPVSSGDLILMPSQSPSSVGVKLATVAPGNPSRGLTRINAVYVLFDGDTLAPTRLLDGVALTNLRTPAVSVAAVKPWLDRIGRPLRVVAFGAGPQGIGHLEVLADCYPIETATVIVRQPSRVSSEHEVLAADDPAVPERLRAADVVVCATTAREPLFDSALLSESAIVIAVGSHEAAAREVDGAFCGRATVVVEDPATALREGGDVIQAIAEGALAPTELVGMCDLARGEVQPADGAVFFKGSGMSWQDLVVAEAVLARVPIS